MCQLCEQDCNPALTTKTYRPADYGSLTWLEHLNVRPTVSFGP